jgi:hypothetical protein
LSDNITEVHADSGAALADYGHLAYGDAVDRLTKHLQRQRDEAVNGLADIEAGRVRVFHQRGVYVAHNRREVQP